MKHLFKCLLALLIFMPGILAAQSLYARRGVLDLKQWNFKEQGAVSLNGEWEFYMSELVSPQDFKKQVRLPQDYIDFPATWNDLSKSLRPGQGYATYRLKTVVQPDQPLALELPHFYSSYALWINSTPVAFNGKVGTSEQTSAPQWRPQTVTFQPNADTLDIVIQVSNFHHASGGVREPVRLGDPATLNLKRSISTYSTLALFAALNLLAFVFVSLFFFSKNDRSQLYLAAMCLTWGIRALFSNQYVVNSYFPDFPWELCVKIEYISLYLMMIWAVLFLGSVFHEDSSAVFKYLFSGCNAIFVALTLFFKASLYTQFLPVYLSFALALLLYGIYVLIRALVYEREGVWMMISCVFVSLVLFAYDLTAYEGFATYHPIVLNIGYLCIFLLVSACLLIQLGYWKQSARKGNILTYEDLYGDPGEKKR